MQIIVEGKNIELTQALKDYVDDKLGKMKNHFENIIKDHDIKVKLSTARNPRIEHNNIAEVTIFVDGKIIRSEQASEDMYASIDLVSDKLERQLRKYKDKHYRSKQHHKHRAEPNPELMGKLIEENNHSHGKIIKSKKFKLHPLTPEEASVQLDLISHDFYVFINSKTKQMNTIYRRKDGDYGLIEPIP